MSLRKLYTLSLPLTFCATLASFQLEAARQTFQLPHIKTDVSVDGVMDETVWANAMKMDLKYENRPGQGILSSVNTEVYVYENGSSLNVAIVAHDPNPKEIRASLRDRDALWADDNVGIIIDTFNDERSGYEFFVNPLGAQADMRMDDTNGWNEDDSWDAIWSSAGRITETGYVVEMSIPFSALRFPDTDKALTWSIAGFRNRPRDVRTQTATYSRDRDIKCNLCQFDKVEGFEAIETSNNFQVTPTLTVSRSDEKEDVPGPWNEGDFDSEPGLDIRWGVTQDIVLNATLNPDFSQVEADAGQLDINNTFSLFFNEKRPFFLDGASYFDTSSFNLVHTRNIADPDYGAKLTGKTGDHSYGLMIANDNTTNFIVPGTQGSDIAELDIKSNVAIASYKMDVGERSNIGTLMTHRSAADYSNTVLSVDGRYGLNDSDIISYQIVRSETDNPLSVQDDFEVAPEQSGSALSVRFNRNKKNYGLKASYQNIGDDFRADLGFNSRVGTERVVLGGSQKWFGEDGDTLTEWGYFGDWDKTFDQDGNVLEEEYEIHGNIQGSKQLFSNFGVVTRERFHDGEYFDETQFMTFAEFKPVANLLLGTFVRVGDQIDFANTRLGDVFDFEAFFVWDVNQHMRVRFTNNHSTLDVDEGELFSANQSDLRVNYQFDMRSQLKLVIQYTDIERDPSLYILEEDDDPVDKNSKYFSSQLIYSYKVNPQTLFYLGYSDGGFQDDSLHKIERDQRTLFTKFSYAWQM